MKVLIVGASAGLGRALAEKLAAAGHELFFVASDSQDLSALTSDLKLRFQVRAHFQTLDLGAFDVAALKQEVLAHLGGIDWLFYVAGLYPDEEPGKVSAEVLQAITEVNFSAGVKIVNAFLPELQRSSSPNLVGIGSIAAARARGRNTVYAASKRAFEMYFDGLRHYFAQSASSSHCKLQFYRLGYMRTQMLQAKGLFPSVSPEWVADRVLKGLGKDKVHAYLPGWWRWVAGLYCLLPWVVFKRVKL